MPGTTAIDRGLSRAVANAEALHWINDPRHADACLREVEGKVRHLRRELSDDPALAAYQVRDALRWIHARHLELWWWCQAVIDATPEQVPESGARLPE